MSLIPDETLQALLPLGFSELEAAIYAYLLRHPSSTGYRVAQALGKPVANTYKALSALQLKGAVIVDEGDSRAYLAVPPSEIFAQMERTLRLRCATAGEALAKLESYSEDDRVYRLQSWEQVMERARQMIDRAEQVVLLAVFPALLDEVRAELEGAARRGVGVLLKLYQPDEVQGACIVLSNETDYFLRQFPAQELSLCVDAREQLQAMLSWKGREVLQGIWNSSAFLSFNHYNGLYSEWLLTRLTAQINSGAPRSALDETLNRSYPLMRTPGYTRLVSSFDRPEGKVIP
jgi:HTH-type transcriptional regulator, sugar sensing transcriptional regulator